MSSKQVPYWMPDRLFGIKVERHEIPRSGGQPYHPNTGDLAVVLHTTEGDSVDGAVSTLEANKCPSHVVVGEGRIVQMRPLSATAAALHDPMNEACLQIEMVGHSEQEPWLPDDPTLRPALAVLAYFSTLGVCMDVPYSWPDDLSDCPLPWAADNARRKQAQADWPSVRGVFMHLEVPYQGPSWHWDCGAIRRSAIVKRALALATSGDWADAGD